MKFLQWISGNPAAAASLVSAVMAASVAVLVFAVTQFLMRRRDRVQFLLPKLEELYLLINKISEDNVKFFRLVYLALEGDPEGCKGISDTDELDLYGHRTAKRIILHIRLYFPRLARIHQMLFAAQRELNGLVYQLHTERPPDLAKVVAASGRVGHFLRLMEEEIIENRDYLLCDHILPKRYRETSHEAIESEIPPPNVEIMSPPLGGPTRPSDSMRSASGRKEGKGDGPAGQSSRKAAGNAGS